MRLDGTAAVVTGGSQGIGAAVARALAAEGAAVVVVARTGPKLEAVAAAIRATGRRVWAVPCDVTDPASVRALAEAAVRHLGRADILVNNAGVGHSAPLHRLTLDDWQRVMAVNATGTFLCTQAFLPGMLERDWGRIVNVASMAGLSGARYIAAYSAAKHAVIGFTRSVAAEVAGTGVTCNAVCPGYVNTEMTRESVERVMAKTGKSREEALAAMLGTTSQRRLIPPEEVAEAILALCERRSGHINGAAITIDASAAA